MSRCRSNRLPNGANLRRGHLVPSKSTARSGRTGVSDRVARQVGQAVQDAALHLQLGHARRSFSISTCSRFICQSNLRHQVGELGLVRNRELCIDQLEH